MNARKARQIITTSSYDDRGKAFVKLGFATYAQYDSDWNAMNRIEKELDDNQAKITALFIQNLRKEKAQK